MSTKPVASLDWLLSGSIPRSNRTGGGSYLLEGLFGNLLAVPNAPTSIRKGTRPGGSPGSGGGTNNSNDPYYGGVAPTGMPKWWMDWYNSDAKVGGRNKAPMPEGLLG
jgi:hypothetical protein